MKLNIRNKKKIPTTKQRVAQCIDQVISFTSSSFSRPFLSIQSGVFFEKYLSRRSSCAQWTTAAWCPRSSGSTPLRTTSPSPWSRCCLLAKMLLTILLEIFLTILLMFKLHWPIIYNHDLLQRRRPLQATLTSTWSPPCFPHTLEPTLVSRRMSLDR